MPDHLIQLRRAWFADADERSRIDLPITWADRAIPARLSRSFQGPRLEPGREKLFLRFESLAGVRSVRLNDRDLGPIPAGDGPWEVAISEWGSSGNRLNLDVDPEDVPRDEVWGRIALVIRS